jgi:hypothetical protein
MHWDANLGLLTSDLTSIRLTETRKIYDSIDADQTESSMMLTIMMDIKRNKIDTAPIKQKLLKGSKMANQKRQTYINGTYTYNAV